MLKAVFKDGVGNPIAGKTVMFASTGSANVLQPAMAMTDVAGTATATLASTKVEIKTVTATLDKLGMNTTVTFVVGPASMLTSSVSAQPPSLIADGMARSTLTVKALDRNMNPVSGQLVQLSATGANNDLQPAMGLTDMNGVFTATLSSTLAEAKTVVANLGMATVSTKVTFVPGPVDAKMSTIEAKPAMVVADGMSKGTLTITARDAQGNPVAGQLVQLMASGSANMLAPAMGMTDAAGQFVATLASTKAESKMVTAQIDKVSLETTAVFLPGPPSAMNSSLVANPAKVPADATTKSILTVTLKDAQGNPVPAAMVALSANLPGANFVPAMGVTDMNGVFTASVTAFRIGPLTVTARSGNVSVQAQIEFTATACAGTLLLPSVPLPLADPQQMPGMSVVNDLNGDGKPDIVTAIGTGISVMLGKGKGLFQQPAKYPGHYKESYLALDDFDKDGKVDVVTLFFDAGGGFDFFRGRGDGTFVFGALVQVGTPPYTSAPVAGDFDKDGRPDLAFVASDTTFAVALGNGDGTFRNAKSFMTVLHADTPITLDVNGDNKLDLAFSAGNSELVVTHAGNGDGTFQAAVTYAAIGRPYGLASGDLDRDGRPDLVAALLGKDAVSVFINRGGGIFAAGVNVPAGLLTGFPALADFDGDGKLDVTVIGQGEVGVLLGKGNGTFGARVAYAAGSEGMQGIGADMDGDGKTDLVVNDKNGQGVLLLPGRGDGTLVAPGFIPVDHELSNFVTADFNRDGKVDAAMSVMFNNEFYVSLGNGDGTFGPGAKNTGGVSATGDFNGDGIVDLVNGGISVFLGKGDGTFGAGVNTPGPGFSRLAAGDLDGDGKSDVVLCSSLNAEVDVYLSNGNGTFKPGAKYAVLARPYVLDLGDLNGDGKPDVATGNLADISVLLNDGKGLLQPPSTLNTGNQQPRTLTLGDVNGDGKLDLLTAYWNGDGAVFLGKGNGTFDAAIPLDLGLAIAWSLRIGDLNADGKPDLVAVPGYTSSIILLYGKGDGTFTRLGNYSAGFNPQDAAVVDLDGDGRLDIAVANNGVKRVTTLLQRGCIP